MDNFAGFIVITFLILVLIGNFMKEIIVIVFIVILCIIGILLIRYIQSQKEKNKRKIKESISNSSLNCYDPKDKRVVIDIIKSHFKKRLFENLEKNYKEIFGDIDSALNIIKNKSKKCNFSDISDSVERIRSMTMSLNNIILKVSVNIEKFFQTVEIRYSTINRLILSTYNEADDICEYIKQILYTIRELDKEINNILNIQDDFFIRQHLHKSFKNSDNLTNNLYELIKNQKEISKGINDLYTKYN